MIPSFSAPDPRVYGLGDLSQILDQRAYDQNEAFDATEYWMRFRAAARRRYSRLGPGR
jgi:hypothetical protein